MTARGAKGIKLSGAVVIRLSVLEIVPAPSEARNTAASGPPPIANAVFRKADAREPSGGVSTPELEVVAVEADREGTPVVERKRKRRRNISYTAYYAVQRATINDSEFSLFSSGHWQPLPVPVPVALAA